MSDLRSLLHELLDGGYVLFHRNKYKFTDKFYEEISGVRQGITRTKEGEVVVVEPLLPAVMPPKEINWTDKFIQFILDAEVPTRINDNKGTPYAANKYSEEGMKAFRKAIEKDKVSYQVLVNSTKLYYKSSIGFKKAIGNYMSQGDWRSDYRDLLASAENGSEAVNKRIENETRGSHTGYDIG